MPEKTFAALDRILGPGDAAAIIISNVIGVGIFTTPGVVAKMSPHPAAALSVWLIGGFLAFAGATAYAQLAVRSPKSGGEYVYLRQAFGPLAGFLSGWTSFVAGFSGAIAAGAVGLAAYLGRYFPAAGNDAPLLRIPLYFLHLDISRQRVVALIAIFALSWLHIRGLGPGRIVQNALAGAKVVALLLLVLVGFSFGHGDVHNITIAPARALTFSGWLLAFIPVMFSYSGWNAAAYVAEEVRDPVRNLPRSLFWGTAIVVVIYLLINLLYFYALGISRLRGEVAAGDAALRALFSARAAGFITALIPIVLAGGISAMIIAGPRVYFAMARDGVFLPLAGRVHPRFHTPAISIIAQALWSSLLVLSGTFEQLLIYTGFAVVLFSALACLALFFLRK